MLEPAQRGRDAGARPRRISGSSEHGDMVDWVPTLDSAARCGGDMSEPVQIFWAPAGASMPPLGDQPLVDVTDGDTPNLRMPVRMLSVDTPEVTAHNAQRAAEID